MDWQRLFVTQRPLWQQARLIPFGHALLEKLVHPRKPITAHVYIAQFTIKNIALETMNTSEISDTAQFYTLFDAWIAEDLSAEKLASKPFAPLPILGVPNWWIWTFITMKRYFVSLGLDFFPFTLTIRHIGNGLPFRK
jgi:hypothetical protein